MILSDRTILDLLQSGELSIDPISEQQVGPASVDLRLGGTFLTPRATEGMYSMSEPIEYERTDDDSFRRARARLCVGHDDGNDSTAPITSPRL